MRQIVLDTETTGIDPKLGHRIVEIGAVELIDRKPTGNTYHQYINPERLMEEEVMRIHGIRNERLAQEPVFADIVVAFMNFIEGAELLIHNAPFDIAHLNAELARLTDNSWGTIEQHAHVTDTLALAKQYYPGQRNSLDALCKRLYIDNSARVFHGALLDSQILADVYLAMTGGQTGLNLFNEHDTHHAQQQSLPSQLTDHLVVFTPSNAQQQAHIDYLAQMKTSIWRQLNDTQ